MKKLSLIFLSIISISALQAQHIQNVNPDPNGDPWLVGGVRALSKEEISKIPYLPVLKTAMAANLPYKVNNSQNQYFRSIILQQDGSCAQTSGIAYAYTYEVNFLRGLSSKDTANQYPSHFTYNFLNGGSGDNGSNYTDGWQLLKVNGCPNYIDYGGLYNLGDKGWMTGYDKYFRGMSNRVLDYYKIDVGTPEGLLILKQWLYDHGNGSDVGGLACFSAGIKNVKTHWIFPLNLYAARKYIALSWSDPLDHAMTFVGYDDSVAYDYNGDGKITKDIDITGDSIVDMRDWEIGAMIVANSWGAKWFDSGFIYTPYRNLALKISEGGISNSQVYVVVPEKTHSPEMTVKIRLSHQKRDKISIRAGIAEYINATTPDYSMYFAPFNKTGGPNPMQGNNNDPIEIGFDITPLLKQTGFEPVKFFIQIIEEDKDTSANGTLHSWSLFDYRNGVKEYKCADTGITIVNDSTTSSAIVIDYPGLPPTNLFVTQRPDGVLLAWNKPSIQTGFRRYLVFKENKFFKYCNDSFFLDNFVPNGTIFKVKAEYNTGLSGPSNTVTVSNNLHLPVAGSGYALSFDGVDDQVNCGDSINIANHNFSIEFWCRREPNTANEFVIGHGTWNKSEEGLHIGFRDNKLMCGFWGDDVHTNGTYTDTEWHHWAITYDTATKQQYIYRDGVRAGKRKATANYRGKGTLYIGCMSGNTWFFNGQIDEVRLWNTTRTVEQINAYRYLPLKGNDSGLLAYWRFDERSGDTLADLSTNHITGTLKDFPPRTWVSSDAWQKRKLTNDTDTLIIFGGYSKYVHPVNITILRAPKYGTATIDQLTSQITYTSSQAFHERDTIIYEVKDDSLISTFTVVIFPQFPQSVRFITSSISMSIMPNPVRDKAIILLDGIKPGMLMLTLHDMNGKVLIYRNLNIRSQGKEIQELDLSNFPTGIYLLKASTSSGEQMLRLVKTGNY
jgi:hypothetical protein